MLLITYNNPPLPPSVPGALAKYLPEQGWEVLVLTLQIPGTKRPGMQHGKWISQRAGKIGLKSGLASDDQLRLHLSRFYQELDPI